MRMISSHSLKVLALHAVELRTAALDELQEHGFSTTNSSKGNHAQLFEASVEQVLKFLESARCFQALTILCAQGSVSESLEFLDFKTILGSAFSDAQIRFSVKVIAMQGNEQRISLQQQIHPQIRKELESLGYTVTLDYKNPDFEFKIYYDTQQYFVGLQIHAGELDSRAYRIFSHKASFRGDFAQLLLHEARCNEAKAITICPARDGVLAIETAILKHSLAVHSLRKNNVLQIIPLFAKYLKEHQELLERNKNINRSDNSTITAIEAQGRNQRALRSNIKRAKVEKYITVLHTNVEAASVTIKAESQDLLIVHFTKKDESRLNDFFYFFRSVLKPLGRVLLVTRNSYSLELTSEFTLESSKELAWKGSSYLISLFSKR